MAQRLDLRPPEQRADRLYTDATEESANQVSVKDRQIGRKNLVETKKYLTRPGFSRLTPSPRRGRPRLAL